MSETSPLKQVRILHNDNMPADRPFDDPAWDTAEAVDIASVRPESSDHIPEVKVKIAASDTHLALRFKVKDAYIMAVAEKHNDFVCLDSCVEFFVQPSGGVGYLNFELSMNGTMLLYHVRDPRRPHGEFLDYTPLTAEEASGVKTFPTRPGKTYPETEAPSEWEMGLLIPLQLICGKTSAPLPVPGSVWKGNFYKCADKTSHPHWLSWSPVPRLDFHDPSAFGQLIFE